jgi:hypothetical protein
MPEVKFLETRNIREVWRREDKDFTPWLANPEPMARLFAACGLELDTDLTIDREVRIPGISRSLDILVQLDNGHKVAIENQYSDGDHDHLTRALAYAVGLEVQTIIIVAESHRPEFIAVVDYLNDAGLSFEHGIQVFLVNISVVGIPDGDIVYPIFEVVASPNEWRAAASRAEQGESSEKKSNLYNFHDTILPLLREATGIFTNVRPSSNPWKTGSPGIGGVTISYGANKESTYVQIWFFKQGFPETSRAGYNVLLAHQSDVNEALTGYEVDWRENQSGCVVEVMVNGIGYGTTMNQDKMKTVINVACRMTDIVRKYKNEIATAMSSVEETRVSR